MIHTIIKQLTTIISVNENVQTSITVWHLPKDHKKAIGTVQ